MERGIAAFMERDMNGKEAAFHYMSIRDKARELVMDRENCYACGLCVDVCPGEGVEIVARR